MEEKFGNVEICLSIQKHVMDIIGKYKSGELSAEQAISLLKANKCVVATLKDEPKYCWWGAEMYKLIDSSVSEMEAHVKRVAPKTTDGGRE